MKSFEQMFPQIAALDINLIDWTDCSVVQKIVHMLLNAIETLYQKWRKSEEKLNYITKKKNSDAPDNDDPSSESEQQSPSTEDDEQSSQRQEPNADNNQNTDNSKNIDLSRPPQKPPLESSKPPKKDKRRLSDLTITDIEYVRVEPGKVPKDATHKGYRNVFIQEIEIKRKTICVRLERFSSPTQGFIEASLPVKYRGSSYGAELRAHSLDQYYRQRVTHRKIYDNLYDAGFKISHTQVTNILINNHDLFHQEKEEVFKAGIASTPYQHIDHTGANSQGEKQHHTVLCNEFYSLFVTHPTKDRLSVVDLLLGSQLLSFIINQNAIDYLEQSQIPQKYKTALSAHLSSAVYANEDFENTIGELFPNIPEGYRKLIREAAAIAYYRSLDPSLTIPFLLSDNAGEFAKITMFHLLCWVHTGRAFTDLSPVISDHQQLLDEFCTKLWEFYKKLKGYKENPSSDMKTLLQNQFDELFSPDTGYHELDKKITLTAANKDKLLLVLDYPELPLHNNLAEQALRELVIKRKISFGTRSEKGVKAWDTFMSLSDTCRKLNVRFFDYLKDRLTAANQIPPLAQLILEKAARLRARAPT